MTVRVSQSTFDALTAQHSEAVAAATSYSDAASAAESSAADLAAVLADLEVAP